MERIIVYESDRSHYPIFAGEKNRVLLPARTVVTFFAQGTTREEAIDKVRREAHRRGIRVENLWSKNGR